jgi:hypothetical protein
MNHRSANLTYADLMRLRRELADKDFAREQQRRTDNKRALNGSLWGMPVIETPLLTKTLVITRNLSWRDRLLCWPWRPWVKEVVTKHTVPSDEVFVVNCDGVHLDIDPPVTGFPRTITGRLKMVMHPEAAAILKDIAP